MDAKYHLHREHIPGNMTIQMLNEIAVFVENKRKVANEKPKAKERRIKFMIAGEKKGNTEARE